jgi:hypothetical protein
VYYFFPTAHFLKTILSQPKFGTFGFAPPHKPTLRKTKKAVFFSSAFFGSSKIINIFVNLFR